MRLVGCKAPQGRHGVGPRGAAPRQGPRTTGPICPEALADHMVQLNRRALETWFKGVIRALATQGVCGVQVTGMVDATDRETTAHAEGCGQVTRTRQLTATRGNVQASDVTVDGWTLMVCIEAGTQMPLAAPVVPIQQPDTRSLRALVTPARTHRAGHTRRHTVVFDRGFWAGGDVWWLAQPGRRLVGPAKEHMAVPLDAQAHAAAGDGVTVGRRAHTVRRAQGHTTWTERLATEGVGIPGRTTDAQSGTPAHGRTHHRRDLQPHLSHAVVVRTGHNRDDGPGGHTVFLTHASVETPLPPFEDDADRRLIAPGCLTVSQQPWRLKHPPKTTARAVRLPIGFTGLMCALATAYRLRCAQEATGKAPVGWQRGRRQLRAQTRAVVMVWAERCYGRLHRAE